MRTRQTWLIPVILLFVGVCGAAFGQSRFAGNDVIVKYRTSAAKVHALPRAFAASRGLTFRKQLALTRTMVVDGGVNADATVAFLQQDPDVEYATRDRWISLTATIPNDTLFPNQYDLYNTGQNGGVPGADIQATRAWDITTGSATITLAISDTGAQMDHPDIASRIWVNPGEIAGNSIDDDSNGFIDDVKGWDFFSDTNSTAPAGSHGTHTLGIAGAAGNNGQGIAGVDWNARMMVVKGFGPSGFGLESDLVNGVIYAIDNGARVINESWGDYDTSPLMEDMALYALANGTLLVTAAGNEGVDTEEYPFYPAGLPYDSVISVGGSEQRDDSIYQGVSGPLTHNYGVAGVHIAAPSWAVPFTTILNTYGSSHGTSYAAPQISGAAGLVLSVFPAFQPPQLKYRLIGTAAAKAGLRERNVGDGRLDVAAAVTSTDVVSPGGITDLAVETSGWNGAVLRFTSPGGDGTAGKAAFYQLRVTTGTITPANWYQLPSTPAYIRPSVRGSTERILLNQLAPGIGYNAAVRGVDSAGNVGTISNIVAITPTVPLTLLQDDCNTTHATWTAIGFALAPGFTNTGTLSWQDSPEANYAPSATSTLTAAPLNLSALSRPRLSFYLRRYFPMNSDRVDSLKVEASTDGGASWQLLKRYHGCHAPMRREVVPLDEVVGSGSTMIRFLIVADSNSVVSDGVYIDDIRVHEGSGGVAIARDAVMETIDYFLSTAMMPDYSITGSWLNDAVAKSLAQKCEGYSSFRVAAGSPATATFTPFLSMPGKYEVLTSWSSSESATGVTYRVKSSAGETVHVLDQLATTGHRWASLGTFTFGYGRSSSNGSIILDASTAAGQNVRSDSIRFRYAELDTIPAFTASSHWQLFD